MLALLVVEVEPSANTGLGFGHSRVGIEVDFFVFETAPQPLDEDVVHAPAPRLRGGRLLPSMLIVIPWSFRVPVNSALSGVTVSARCAFPASRASSESEEMLAFAHIPTGAAANKGFDIDEVNSKLAEPAVALTAIGADIETGRATP